MKLKNKIKKITAMILIILFIISATSSNVFAASKKDDSSITLGTQEVETATQNLQRVITSIAIRGVNQ